MNNKLTGSLTVLYDVICLLIFKNHVSDFVLGVFVLGSIRNVM